MSKFLSFLIIEGEAQEGKSGATTWRLKRRWGDNLSCFLQIYSYMHNYIDNPKIKVYTISQYSLTSELMPRENSFQHLYNCFDLEPLQYVVSPASIHNFPNPVADRPGARWPLATYHYRGHDLAIMLVVGERDFSSENFLSHVQ